MLSINLCSGSFLLISDTPSIRLDSEADIDLMLSINSFSGSFLLISNINYQQDLIMNLT